MVINAALLILGAALSAVFVRRPLAAGSEPDEHRVHIETCAHCGVTGTQLHPADHDH